VTAKARLTYFKGQFLEVSRSPPDRDLTQTHEFSPQLAIHHAKWDEWTTCFAVENVELPANSFLGFTAHTGDVSGESGLVRLTRLAKLTRCCSPDNHDIISVTTSNIVYHAAAPGSVRLSVYRPSPLLTSQIQNKPPPRSFPGLGFFSFPASLMKWVFVLILIGAAVLAFRAYTKQKSAKRF
jgi:mannose-binding lectin 2